VNAVTRKAIAGGTAHLQHALRLGDLPIQAAADLLGKVNVALEGKLTSHDAGLINTALAAVDKTHSTHERMLADGRRELAGIIDRTLTILPEDIKAADERAAAREAEAARADEGGE
jgi:hypothetical protein